MEKYCQSCAMPMGETNEMYGTNEDGAKNGDYCKYCYMEGKFTNENCTVEEMIEICVPHMKEQMPEEEARSMLKKFLPTLERWRNN